MLIPVVVIAIALPSSETAIDVVTPDATPSAQRFTFVYDGVVGVVERGSTRGSDAHRVAGTFVDERTGRTAPVLVGSTVLVRGSLDTIDASIAATIAVVHESMPSIPLTLVESTHPSSEDALELAERLSARGIDAYPNLAFRKRAAGINIPPNDPFYADEFHLSMIDIESAWKISTGSGVTVLIADDGCDLEHPDLAAKMDAGFDPFNSTTSPSASAPGGFIPNVNGDNPDNEHGTSCAGIVAAVTDNGVDVAGACPECRLRCARLLPAKNETSTVDSDVLTYGFALDQNVDVVSNSWGFVDAIPVPGPLKDAIVHVESAGRNGKGALVVFASGNDGRVVGDDELLAVDGIIGVGAVDSFGELTQFSNGGNSVDVVAPTGTVTTDIAGADGGDPGDVNHSFGGTSSACPVVSGVAGLLASKFPDKKGSEIAQAIVDTAKQSSFATPDGNGHDTYYGFGLIQPAAALHAFDAKPPSPKETAPSCSSSTAPSSFVFALCAIALGLRRPSRRSCAA